LPEYAVGYLIALLILIVIAVLLLRRLVRPVTVMEYERGMRYARGRFTGVLPPGMYWVSPWLTTVRRVDMRATSTSIAGQDVLTADGVGLKVSIAARYEVADPVTAINGVESYQNALYLDLQLALREIVGGAVIDDLLQQRATLGQRLVEITAPRAERLGLRLLDAEIKDIMFPGELKKIFTQVVKARQEGLAALERARGETAALRNLANAARMLEQNPALLQLRLLQVAGQSTGNTLVIGVPPQAGPIPIRDGQSPPPPEAELPPADSV
jgi:regulator of protease activity HflC (stomatin/prohibitin superfamily)